MSIRWYHYVLAFLVTALGAVAFALGRRSDKTSVETELEVIDLRQQTKDRIAERDAATARAEVETFYAETIKQLDDEQKVLVNELRRDPVALGEHLARTAAKLRAEQG